MTTLTFYNKKEHRRNLGDMYTYTNPERSVFFLLNWFFCTICSFNRRFHNTCLHYLYNMYDTFESGCFPGEGDYIIITIFPLHLGH